MAGLVRALVDKGYALPFAWLAVVALWAIELVTGRGGNSAARWQGR